MQTLNSVFRRHKGPINLTVLEVDGADLLIPTARKQQVVLLVHGGEAARLCEFVDAAANLFFDVPLAHGAVLGAAEQVVLFESEVIDFVGVAEEGFLLFAEDFLFFGRVVPEADQAVVVA